MDPVLDPASPATKPGYKSTEAWISLVIAVLGAVMASGLLDPTDPTQAKVVKIIGMVLAIATATGYTAGRSYVKATAIKGAALVAAASAEASSAVPTPPTAAP